MQVEWIKSNSEVFQDFSWSDYTIEQFENGNVWSACYKRGTLAARYVGEFQSPELAKRACETHSGVHL